MNTLASILSGAGANPYQGGGGGISPLVQQLILAHQMGAPQIGQAPGDVPNGASLGGAMPNPIGTQPLATSPIPGLPPQQSPIGSLAQLAIPGLATGAY